MSVVVRWDVSKDVNTRHNSSGNTGRGGNTLRYIGKGDDGEWFRYFLKFDPDFGDMSGGLITAADIVLHTNTHGIYKLDSRASVVAYYLTQDFANDGGVDWTAGAYVNPNSGSTEIGSVHVGVPTSDDQPFRISVLRYIERIASGSIRIQIGTKQVTGQHNADHGVKLRAPDEGSGIYRVVVYSDDAATDTHSRPYLEITYDPANVPPTGNWGTPFGASSVDDDYEGTYFDADGDVAASARVQVWRGTDTDAEDNPSNYDTPRYDSGDIPWNPSWPDDQYVVPPPQRLKPPKTALSRKDGNGNTINYRGRVRLKDKHDTGPWTPLSAGHFTVVTADPTVTPTHLNTQVNLSTVQFHAVWSFDPAAGGLASYRVQLTIPSDSAAWASPIWDHTFAPTAAEEAAKTASFVYLGPSLPAGSYSWRIQVVDQLGGDSLWGQDDSLVLTDGTTTSGDPPDNSTVYGRFAITTRLVMQATDGPDRGPGTVVAIIENPYNLGVTGNATTPGQLYFSLPNKHPQISAMEPMRTHWSLQQYRGSEWKELTAGLLTDFDATENDTVFNGLDYLGILGLSIEAKSQPEDHAEASWEANGAKYVNHSISFIIGDQLTRATQSANSPLGFFEPSPMVDSMLERVTIHSAYAQRLDFIRGLMESHRGGASGRRSRITAAKNPVNGHYEFSVRSNAGKDRPNLLFQYGGLVQAYRVMALGDWADKIYGVGRLRNQLQPHYKSLVAPGVDLGDWGEIAKANVWQDISDLNDLTRRATQLATELSRAGKRIALGLRVHSLGLLDGWGICDNIQIDIEHGSVFTPDYGTAGWWTIWGWEWRLYPDGHDELTLVLKPTEGVGSPVDDLIPSTPIHVQPEWTVMHGPPGTDWLRLDAGYFLDDELRLDTRL